MDKKGRLAIEYIFFLIIMGIVLFSAVYWFLGTGSPIREKIKETSEGFTERLDDLSLTDLKEAVKKNPGAVMDDLFKDCSAKVKKKCEQYVSICERGEDTVVGSRKFTSQEVAILQEFCNKLESAKVVLRSLESDKAGDLYEKYTQENDVRIKNSYEESLRNEYPNSYFTKLITLKGSENFEEDASNLFVEFVTSNNAEALFLLGEAYLEKADGVNELKYKGEANKAYGRSLDIMLSDTDKADPNLFVMTLLKSHEALGTTVNPPATETYLVISRGTLEAGRPLKEWVERSEEYGKLIEKVAAETRKGDIKTLNVRLFIDSTKGQYGSIGGNKIISIKRTVPFEVEVKEISDDFSFIEVTVDMNSVAGTNIESCKYKLEADEKFYSVYDGIYCNQFDVKFTSRTGSNNVRFGFDVEWAFEGPVT